jgi:hypothetical protein
MIIGLVISTNSLNTKQEAVLHMSLDFQVNLLLTTEATFRNIDEGKKRKKRKKETLDIFSSKGPKRIGFRYDITS